MAVHNFNYSYEYVGCKTIPLSMDDDTQIVKHITIKVTAIDQVDSSKTASTDMEVSLDGIYSYKFDGLPDNFIQVEDLTNQKIIDWYKAKTQIADLDIHFTVVIYGREEIDPPINEE